MSLVLNDDQLMLQEAARNFLAEKAPVTHFRRLRDAGETNDPELWRAMVELGWPTVAVPEEFGGTGFGMTAQGLIAIEAGRNLVTSPLQTTAGIGVAALLHGANDAARRTLLPKISAGDCCIALAVDEGNHHDPLTTAVTARPAGAGYVLNGTKACVAEGNHADYFVTIARNSDGHLALLLVAAGAAGVMRTPVRLMDSRDYANVDFSDVSVGDDSVLADGESADSIIAKVIDIATVIAACELFGIALETFERTVQYLKDREQFGRAIGSFQALQHRAAHAFAQLELLKSVILDALDAVDCDRKDLPLAASHAKALANDTAQLVTNEAIQMHGGIGLTDDLDIGLFFKRARVLRNTYGLSAYHRRRYARLSGY